MVWSASSQQIARLALAGFAVIGMVLGCGGDSTVTLKGPEKLTLYSIDPLSNRKNKRAEGPDAFHGYAVLGRIEIAEGAARLELANALKESLEKENVSQKKCFDPRHGIRATRNGETREYVICFSCNNAYIHGKDAPTELVPIAPDHQEKFTKRLTDAGIKLAP